MVLAFESLAMVNHDRDLINSKVCSINPLIASVFIQSINLLINLFIYLVMNDRLIGVIRYSSGRLIRFLPLDDSVIETLQRFRYHRHLLGQ